MSSPSSSQPSKVDYASLVVSSLVSAEEVLAQMQCKYPDHIPGVLAEVTEKVKSLKPSLVVSYLTQASHEGLKSQVEKLDQVFAPIDAEHKGDLTQSDCDELNKLVVNIKKAVSQFTWTVDHFDEIQQKGLDHFLDDPMGYEEFANLLELEHPWAQATLKRLLDQHHPMALKLMLIYAYDSDFVLANKDLEWFQKAMSALAEQKKDSESHYFIFRAARKILEVQDCQWAQAFLIEHIERRLPPALENLAQLCVAQPARSVWAFQYLFCGIHKGNNFIAAGLYLLISTSDEATQQWLLTEFLRHRSKNEEVELTLIGIAVLMKDKTGFQELVRQNLAHFSCFRFEYDGFQEAQYERLIQYCGRMRTAAENTVITWSETGLDYRVTLIKMYFHAQMRFMRCLMGLLLPPIDKAMTDCFPYTLHLLTGESLTEEGDLPEATKHLTSILEAYGVEVAILYSTEPTEETLKKVKVIEGTNIVNNWVRDYMLTFDHRVRVPLVDPLVTDEMIDQLPFNVNNRLQPRLAGAATNRYPFSSYCGSVSKDRVHLAMGSFMMRSDYVPFDVSEAESMVFIEQGNTLIGENYAIIGKNTLTLNLLLAAETVKELGLVKVGDQWQLGTPGKGDYDAVTEQDITRLFEYALGVSTIYYVEQPEFHIDTSMALIGPKKVLLNDSVMAQTNWDRYVSEQGLLEGKNEMELKLYQERQEACVLKAVRYKAMEDLAELDLLEQGFEVVRAGLNFQDLTKDNPESYQYSLANFISMTTPDGRKIIYALNVPDPFKETFRELIQLHVPDIFDIHFHHDGSSRELMARGGGVHCAMRTIPLTS